MFGVVRIGVVVGLLVVGSLQAGLVGLWEFENGGDLGAATVGNDLTLNNGGASISATTGVTPGDGAVTVGVGDSFSLAHGLGPNGGSTAYVNEYTMVYDVYAPGPGSWRSLLQTTTTPGGNDGDYWISPGGNLGVSAIGYSGDTVNFDQWYRIVLATDIGSSTFGGGSFRTTVTDELGNSWAFDHSFQGLDGRHSLYSTANSNIVHFFSDNDGEDGLLTIARLAMYDEALSPAEALALGAPGNPVPEPSTVALVLVLFGAFALIGRQRRQLQLS